MLPLPRQISLRLRVRGRYLRRSRRENDVHHPDPTLTTRGKHLTGPRLVTRDQIQALVHGEHPFGRANSWLAVRITRSVGTMWAAYLFVLISLLSLPQAWAAFVHGDTITGVAWLSQSFLQLVLLPIVLVGQNVISTAQETRAETDHETLTALHALNVQQLELLQGQQTILELLRPQATPQSADAGAP
jgi:hypothetical protein